MPRRSRKQRLETVGAWASELPDSYLTCRDLGHTWHPHRAWMETLGNASYHRVMRCKRCHTERTQGLNRQGHVVTNSYDYAEGYLGPKGQGRLVQDERDHLRLASVLRMIPTNESEAS